MTTRVLVPFDGSPLSRRALEHACEVFSSAGITAIHVINPVDAILDVEAGGLPVAEGWHDSAMDRSRSILEDATELAREYDVELRTVTKTGRPAREIRSYADERDISHIVMGSHGRDGIERALLGSVAETVTRRSRIPVTIVR